MACDDWTCCKRFNPNELVDDVIGELIPLVVLVNVWARRAAASVFCDANEANNAVGLVSSLTGVVGVGVCAFELFS